MEFSQVRQDNIFEKKGGGAMFKHPLIPLKFGYFSFKFVRNKNEESKLFGKSACKPHYTCKM